MSTAVDFDTGHDLDDFVKNSDESESEPEQSESEAEYKSSSEEEEEEENNNNDVCPVSHRVRVTRRRSQWMGSYVEPVDTDKDKEGDDESEAKESDGDDSEVDDDNPEVPIVTTARLRIPVARPFVPPDPPARLTMRSSWCDAVVCRHFSADSGIRHFAHSRAVGQHWIPKPNQRIRVGDVKGDSAFYAGKEGIVLGPSHIRKGKWRVTVHGSALETALHGETGVSFHSSDLTPTTSLKLHLNTVPTEELPILRVLVASITPAIVRSIQRTRPFKSWPDFRKRVPDLTDATAALLKDMCAVNMASTNTTWRAFAALGNDYATQLTTWSNMTVNQRLDARDDASEVIEAEKAERRRERERVRAATAAPTDEPSTRRPRRTAAIAADAIGYREEDAWRLRMLEAQTWQTMQEE